MRSGTAAGGISGPLLFANLIKTGKVGDTALAFAIGATLMIAAGLVASVLGVKAEQKSLEDIATPLTAEEVDKEAGDDEGIWLRVQSERASTHPRWVGPARLRKNP